MKNTIGDFYKKIVIRHLEWDRPDSALDMLERFVDEVQGAKYSFRLGMLKHRNTINLGKNPINLDGPVSENSSKGPNSDIAKAKLVENGRAFFCSELVVKAFKCCGIMQQTNEACSNFLPGDMSSAKNRLNLVDGATLGPEELIFTETMFNAQQEELSAANK